jgi:hypothetical protein
LKSRREVYMAKHVCRIRNMPLDKVDLFLKYKSRFCSQRREQFKVYEESQNDDNLELY